MAAAGGAGKKSTKIKNLFVFVNWFNCNLIQLEQKLPKQVNNT